MKTKTIIPLLLSIILPFGLWAQTETNVEKLNQLSEELAQEYALQQQRVQQYAAEHSLEITYETPDGVLYQMVDVRDGQPVYVSTDNLGAAYTTRAVELWEGGSTGLDLTGDGYDKLGEWDGGKVRTTHQEFTNLGASRVTQMDNTSGLHFHATHVAGTMVAGGVILDAKGMAYEGSLKAWDWNNDLSEMTSAASNGLEISNHSYGYPAGWEQNSSGSWQWYGSSSISADEDYKFGFYTTESRYADLISFNAPNYLIVTSAGNERGEGPSYAGTGSYAEIDGGDDGYDCIGGHFAAAKNTLAVGAVFEVMNYTGPASVNMTSFSSWGPVDDGRVKPDVVAKGQNVYSTLESSNTAYTSMSGTSMAAPNASGTLALLQHYYQSLNGGTPMRAATLKGLVIHTADEAGPDPGPDYKFGWGLVNGERASQIISDNLGQNVMDELVLEENDTYTREVTVPEGTNELRVTLCWTDPPATSPAPALNSTTPMLVNDLDLYITDSEDNMYYPFKLDPADPTAAATNDSRNNVDNLELVSIMAPAPGTYTIHVEHEDNLTNDEQAYSLIISGTEDYTVVPECSAELTVPENGAEDVLINEFITWAPADFASSYDVYFGTDGGGTTTPTDIYNGENVPTNGFMHIMDLNTTYYLQVVPRNNNGTAEDCSDIWSFTTMDGISEFPYTETMEGAEIPGLPEYWSSIDYSDINWISTTVTANNGSKSVGCYYPVGLVETDMDNWFVSPPLALEAGMSYPLTFYYRSFSANQPESLSVYWGMTPDTADFTNLLFEAIDFTGSGWQEATANLAPGFNGVVFLGFHATSTPGYGVFVDDITIETGTAVGVGESGMDKAMIYAVGGNIRVDAGDAWTGADLLVSNLMGQVVYEGRYDKPRTIELNGVNNTGMFFATLVKDGQRLTKKVILSGN